MPEATDNLFFAGDIGQRIFQQPFSWLTQGVDVRGRSFSLKVNYRTSHQIRHRADLLLPPHVRDVDGYEEGRRGTISVFDGPEPDVGLFDTEADEIEFAAAWIGKLVANSVAPHEIAILVRSTGQFDRAKSAIKAAGQKWVSLHERPDLPDGRVVVGTMDLAKGMEFRAVAVMACDDEVIPALHHSSSPSRNVPTPQCLPRILRLSDFSPGHLWLRHVSQTYGITTR